MKQISLNQTIPSLSLRRLSIFVSETVKNKTLSEQNLKSIFMIFEKSAILNEVQHTHICKLIVKDLFDLLFLIKF